MKNVLVFPCGSEIGLEIYQSLSHSIHFNLFGASSIDDHGSYLYENYIGQLPFISDSDFLNALKDLIDKFKIDFIFPAHDDVVLKLSEFENKKLLGNAKIIGSDYSSCQITRSKKNTYHYFKNILNIPKLYSPSEVVDGRCFFLKPDIGQGSKGTYKVNSKAEINFYIKQDPSLLILEYLPGKEYTIDCFTDRFGKLRFVGGRQRLRINNGISVRARSVENEEFLEIAEKINNNLKLNGIWFFQLKENSTGKLSLMEIATRVAGTMGYHRNKGINLPLLSLFDKIGHDIEIFENGYELELDRALCNRFKHNISYKSVYLDFDDTILIKGKINTAIIGFIFQCLNEKVKIYLITRHSGDIYVTLQKFRLDKIFDKIIHLKTSEKKSDYINPSEEPIFIDDSFSERRDVNKKLKIPVFDTSMIELLLKN